MAKIVLALLAPLFLSSCLAAAAVGAGVGLAGDVVEGAVNTTGAVVGAAIPDDEDEDDDKDKDDD